jgi:hypothetical protein
MATKNLNKIFLSASVPLPERNPLFYETADFVAIRDAVRALATVVIPKAHLVWGGHPSITPLIRYVMNVLKIDSKEHITLYQSIFFEEFFPKDNFAFENIQLTEKKDTLLESVNFMRIKMISENDFKAGIFIGGMEGINDEYNMFKKYHPNALVIPVASTGAASKLLYKEIPNLNKRLESDYAYMSLFRDLLEEYIN